MRYPDFDGSQACAQVGTDLFYPISASNQTKYDRETIHELCYSCQFQSSCLEWGIRHETEGIWGGLNPSQRAALRRAMGITLQSVPVAVYLQREVA